MKSAVAGLVAATAAVTMAAGSVAVGTADELEQALAAAAKDPSAPREIVVRAGRYLLERPLEVAAVTGLVLRAERPGAVELCGGVRVTGWSKVEGTPFWAADAKDADGKPAFFRALAKNGEWVETAVVPGGTNRFEHSARFGAFLLPNLAGHWSRPPTDEENCVMPYDAKDIPDAMDIASADIHLLHMWSDSLCTVESIDRAAKIVKVKETPDWPMGAQGKYEYEIFNVREGMAPGRWFLDRRAGRVYYQPLPGEEVEKLDFIRPTLRHVLVLNDSSDVRIEGIVFSGATPAYGAGAGFGGISAPAAVVVRKVDRVELLGVGIRNTAGVGLNISGSSDVLVDGCSITSCGACAAFVSGANVVVRRTLVSGAGLVHRASCGVFASGSDIVIAGNEVKNVPYSGLIVFGDRNRVEDNFIHHVMQVLHDGAAVYGLFVDGAMRGNVVKDIVACGAGFGVHAYYADENSRNTVVEGNYAEGMPVPIHNHMSAGIVVRNNTLVNEGGDMVVSFERSVGCTFAGNRIFCGGKLDTVWLDGIADWRGNVVLNGRDAPFEWNPPREPAEGSGGGRQVRGRRVGRGLLPHRPPRRRAPDRVLVRVGALRLGRRQSLRLLPRRQLRERQDVLRIPLGSGRRRRAGPGRRAEDPRVPRRLDRSVAGSVRRRRQGRRARQGQERTPQPQPGAGGDVGSLEGARRRAEGGNEGPVRRTCLPERV